MNFLQKVASYFVEEKKLEYTSNLQERLRQIKQIESRYASFDPLDFIDLTLTKKK